MIIIKMKQKHLIIFGGIVGALLIFFFRLFPVPVWNIEHTAYSFWWNNGLMNFHLYSIPAFITIEILGMLVGILFICFGDIIANAIKK